MMDREQEWPSTRPMMIVTERVDPEQWKAVLGFLEERVVHAVGQDDPDKRVV